MTTLRERLSAYAQKAAREAKEQTSWIEPDEAFESSLSAYIDLLLPADANTGFARYFEPMLDRAAWSGFLNTLSATVLKLTAPGIPDTYQGTECPHLVLVDPDNRRTPDYAAHAAQLQALAAQTAEDPVRVATDLLEQWRDGRLKQWLTWRLLQLRHTCAALSPEGSYTPIAVEGRLASHLCAYARTHEGHSAIVLVSRFAATLSPDALSAPLGARWDDAALVLPDAVGHTTTWVDALTGRSLALDPQQPQRLQVSTMLEILPVSVLISGPCT